MAAGAERQALVLFASTNAEATAEMLRPYPLGTALPPTSALPDVTGMSLDETFATLTHHLWSAERLVGTTEPARPSCHGTFLQAPIIDSI